MATVQHDPLAVEMLDRWTALNMVEKEQLIRQIRDEVPGAEAIASALERHYRSLLARATTSQAAA